MCHHRGLGPSPSTADGPPRAISSSHVVVTALARGGFEPEVQGPVSKPGRQQAIHTISGPA
jgi:hypothetical protein